MALSVTILERTKVGRLRKNVVRVTFDSSYPAGGESLTAARLGLTKVVHVSPAEPSGYEGEYDLTNSKLKAFQRQNVYTAAVDPASIAAGAVANTAVTVTGVTTSDRIVAIPPNDLEAGLVLQSAWVSAADTVQVRLQNASAGAVDGASKTWTFLVFRDQQVEVKNGTDLSAVSMRLEVIGY